MPQKKIVIPPPIHLLHPETGAPVEGPEGLFDFGSFLNKLNSNPLWVESWQAGMAQRSIGAAFTSAKEGHFVISEEDWKFLETAAKNPRMMLLGAGQSAVIPGLGIHPSLAGQVIPFQLAIINAETV